MIRDEGPRYSAGYGLSSKDLVPTNSREETGVNPQSSFIAKSLYGHPLLRFVSAGAASLVGMYVAGKFVKEGGLFLRKSLDEEALPLLGRETQRRVSDELKQVTQRLDEIEGRRSFVVEGRHITKNIKGQTFSDEAIRFMAGFPQTAQNTTNMSTEAWNLRDEIKQRLVSQARRLPYELPALYITQRGLPGIPGTDELFYGQEAGQPKVKWSNPVDVVTDFAAQSTKNLFGLLLPVDAGATAVGRGIKNILGPDSGRVLTQNQAMLRVALRNVGHQATDILTNAVRLTSRTSGALATAFDTAVKESNTMSMVVKGAKSSFEDARAAGASNSASLVSSFRNVKGRGITAPMPTPFNYIGTFRRAFGEAWRNPEEVFSYQSVFERQAEAFRRIGGRGPGSKTFEQSEFFRKNLAESFQRNIFEELTSRFPDVDRGILEQIAYQPTIFPQSLDRIATAVSRGQSVPSLTSVLGIGRKGISAAQNEAMDVFLERMNTYIRGGIRGGSEGLANRITRLHEGASAFEEAYEAAATRFGLARPGIEQEIGRKWEQASPELLRSIADKTGKLKLPYNAFDNPESMTVYPYLVRTSASRLGIPVVDEFGVPRPLNLIETELADKSGFRAHPLRPGKLDPSQLKAFLMNEGEISKYSADKYNLLGLRKLSAKEALQRGLVPKERRASVEYLLGELQGLRPVDKDIFDIGFGGVWESPSGQVVDLRSMYEMWNRIRQGAGQVHIPLLQFSPAQLWGQTFRKKIASTAEIEYEARQPGFGINKVPGLNRAEYPAENSSYFWLRAKRHKGTIIEVAESLSDFGIKDFRARTLPGKFSPFSATGKGMATAHAQWAAQRSSYAPTTPPRRIAKAFSFDTNKEDSVFQWLGRFRTQERKSDIRNTSVFARRILNKTLDIIDEGGRRFGEQGFVGSSGVITNDLFAEEPGRAARFLKGSEVKVTAAAADQEKVDRALINLSRRLRGGYLSPISIKDILAEARTNPNSNLGKLYDARVGTENVGLLSRLDNVRRIRSNHDVVALAAELNQLDDVAYLKGGISGTLTKGQLKERATKLANLKRDLLGDIVNIADEASLNDVPSADFLRYGMSTRREEAESQIAKYIIARAATLKGTSLDGIIQDIYVQLRGAERAGVISGADFLRSKMFLGSLDLGHIRATINTQAGSRVRKEVNAEIVQNLLNRSADEADVFRSVLQDVANNLDAKPGERWLPRQMKKYIQRRGWTVAPYDYPGVQVQPFGGETQKVFVPTFGTAFRRNPAAALKSLAGLGGTEGFSSLSVGPGHLVLRLNNYFSKFGLALNPQDFRGWSDMFARGFIGKRVFPAVAGFSALMTVDRTLGGALNQRDQYGNKVYSPYVTGKVADLVAGGQITLAGLLPGGKTAAEKQEELTQGEVPVRRGRWWPLGSTPFKGGRIQYYRPSWYRRFKSGYMYTKEAYGSPLERFLFYQDFSPLRVLDPYRWERKHYQDRPYPVTGEYFTGPWGPLTPALNMTLGKILKPQVRMHRAEMDAALASFRGVGEAGVFQPAPGVFGGWPTSTDALTSAQLPQRSLNMGRGGGGGYGYGGGSLSSGGGYGGGGGGSLAALGYGGISTTGGMVIKGRKGYPFPIPGRNRSGPIVTGDISSINQMYAGASTIPPKRMPNLFPYTTFASRGYGITQALGQFPQRIMPATPVISPSSLKFQAGHLGYTAQEISGIYGFAFGSMRERLGMGSMDYPPFNPVLQSAASGYGSTRAFWDLNLGGLGDMPTPFEGQYSNVEFSEIIRRFIPKQRNSVYDINPIPNTLGMKYPWLPGTGNITNLKTGDPFNRIPEGEMRLPGLGYERFHQLHPDQYGQYGLIDQYRILSDVAQWSPEFKSLSKFIHRQNLNAAERAEVERIDQQVAAKNVKFEFTPYKYKYSSPEELGLDPFRFAVGKRVEAFTHQNTWFSNKFFAKRTALEDWERNNVYGQTFPQWNRPIQSFIKPMLYKAAIRNPITAGVAGGFLGGMFGKTYKAKALGQMVGGAIGIGASLLVDTQTMTSGQRFIPIQRKKELALEEDIDILNYVKNARLKEIALQRHDSESASYFATQMHRTMYGTDLSGNPFDVLMAIPKRKRDYFKQFIQTKSPTERAQILSTSGRLERRIYEQAWGMPVEARPELTSYFQEHELPPPGAEIWSPNVDMEQIKIKMGQNMGLDMSQMGYYPQQIMEANLVNPAYPQFGKETSSRKTASRLQALMQRAGMDGTVEMRPSFRDQVQFSIGAR